MKKVISKTWRTAWWYCHNWHCHTKILTTDLMLLGTQLYSSDSSAFPLLDFEFARDAQSMKSRRWLQKFCSCACVKLPWQQDKKSPWAGGHARIIWWRDGCVMISPRLARNSANFCCAVAYPLAQMGPGFMVMRMPLFRFKYGSTRPSGRWDVMLATLRFSYINWASMGIRYNYSGVMI